MNHFTSVNTLRNQGFRITRVRKSLLEVFHSNRTPLHAVELANLLLRKDISLNKTTLYRELDFLLDQQLIEVVEFGDGKKRYELRGENHHHHIVCVSCGRVNDIDFDVDLEKHESEISKQTGFKIKQHNIEFFGLCKTCQS